MSRCHEVERAFFLSLLEYNATKNTGTTRKIGMLATVMGDASRKHVRRYYPECDHV